MEINRSYFAIIPANVRYDNSLTPNAKLLYGEITALCNEKGFCWANNAYFAELYGVSNKSISKWINQLINYGYIASEMIYKENSKEIENRILRISYPTPMEQKEGGYGRKVPYPMEEKFHTPMEEKFQDNNTLSNNTFNNIKDIVPFAEIIAYLNQKANTNFRETSKKTKELIKARWNEKHTLEDFKKVIDIKTKEWLNDKNMNKYLRPETLFGTKFEGYLNQKGGNKKNEQQRSNKYNFDQERELTF